MLTADELREAFVSFFVSRSHVRVPSASLIPADDSVMFTVAGMVPFKQYFTGDAKPPFGRAVSIQRCARAGGKHNDLDDIGRTNRHFSFFEMQGNFSFGNYFKAEAIAWAWEYLIDVLKLDSDRLWVTVHHSDDEAADIWEREAGIPPGRIQRLGEANFWKMADTGPCGPSSEIFFDFGPEFGADGGPLNGDEARFVEFWNLVFMQYNQEADGSLTPLPKPSIDTGSGLERTLMVVQNKNSIFDIDVFRPLIVAAEAATGATYKRDPKADVSLRILAEHARTMTFLVSDGVVPSNEGRGYVLRRIARRALAHAAMLGSRDAVVETMVDATVESMGRAYPEIVDSRRHVVELLSAEERQFRRTLESGLGRLEGILERGDIDGASAFYLHDTLGFPIDLTREIAQDYGRSVDLEGFQALLKEQSVRSRASSKDHKRPGDAALYRQIVADSGPTTFVGYDRTSSPGRVVAVVAGDSSAVHATTGSTVDVVLDTTPFYAEGGGQVGDTGLLEWDGGRADVLDTQWAIHGALIIHQCVVREGELSAGTAVVAAVDAPRRERIRRNHTATHLLHWALRETLGKQTKQAGSLVAPDRLRFDFNYPRPVSRQVLDQVEALANREVISNSHVGDKHVPRDEAEHLGAIAFFGEKYSDVVRIVQAGPHSLELCGGTHVHALGSIGPIKIVSEQSIGVNLRRIEAVTGLDALDWIAAEERTLREVADKLRASREELPDRVGKLLGQVKELQNSVDTLRAERIRQHAKTIRAAAPGPVVVTRVDGYDVDLLRLLATQTLALDAEIVGLIGLSPAGDRVLIVVAETAQAASHDGGAADIAGPAARLVGGGSSRGKALSIGGGPRVDAIDVALDAIRQAADAASSPVMGQ